MIRVCTHTHAHTLSSLMIPVDNGRHYTTHTHTHTHTHNNFTFKQLSDHGWTYTHAHTITSLMIPVDNGRN